MSAAVRSEFMSANGLPGEAPEEWAKPPFQIKTIKQFANYGETRAEVHALFSSQSISFKDWSDIVANVTVSWREAEATGERGVHALRTWSHRQRPRSKSRNSASASRSTSPPARG